MRIKLSGSPARGCSGGGSARGLRRVTVVIDAAPLVAFGDANDPYFTRIEKLLRTVDGPLIIPAPVTAEVDYLLGQRVGHGPRRNFVADLAAGRFAVACLEREDYATVGELDARYADLELGLAGCAAVVIAKPLQDQSHRELRRAAFPCRHTSSGWRLHDPAQRQLRKKDLIQAKNGRGEIRTPETGCTRLPVFKTGRLWLCNAENRLLAPQLAPVPRKVG